MGDKPKRIHWTKELFIEKAKEKHGDKFDYSKVEFKRIRDKVIIKCNTCGIEFEESAYLHLKCKYACKTCSRKSRVVHNKISFREFVEKSTEIHHGKFSYDGAEKYYEKLSSKIPITCPVHGVFWQSAGSHMKGYGCDRCAKQKLSERYMLPIEEAIRRAKEKHGDFYDYETIRNEYKGTKKKVPIRCPIHGIFYQTMESHFGGQGCPKCKGDKCSERRKVTFEEFVERAERAHGKGRFEYYRDKYVDACTHTTIHCLACGEIYQQSPISHMRGIGCPNCFSLRRGVTKRATWEYFIEKAAKTHTEGAYSFKREDFVGYKVPMPIKCNTCGRTFMQQPIVHANGHGCPYCKPRKLEECLEKFLKEMDIEHIREKRFDWLRYKGMMPVDFYLPDYGIVIECQGRQHFEPVDFAGRGEAWAQAHLEETQDKDRVKKEKCEEHGLIMLYYNHFDSFPEFSIKLINEIKKRGGK